MDEQTIIATVDAMEKAGTITHQYLAGAVASLRQLEAAGTITALGREKIGDWQFILDNNIPFRTPAGAGTLFENPLVLGLGALLLFRFLKR